MSKDDTISLKEFIHMKTTEISEGMAEIREIASRGLEQATKTNGRVNSHDETLKHIVEVLDSHNNFLVMDEGKQKQKAIEQKEQQEKEEKRIIRNRWRAGILIPFGVSLLGYFGFLYIEHIKSDIITEISNETSTYVNSLKEGIVLETSEQVIQLIETKYSPTVK